MSLPIQITYANPPEGTCPPTIDDLIELLRNITTAEVSTNYVPYIFGFATPAVEDQNKAWIRLDAVGRPLGTFVFYAGSWRRQYTGKDLEITLFQGNPALFFDGTGRGLTTASWDGWALCNGQNGTINLTDKFIVAAHMDNSDGTTGFGPAAWHTKVAGVSAVAGGFKDVTLAVNQIPRAAKDALIVDTFIADGHSRNNSGDLFGHYSGTHDPDGSEVLIPLDSGDASPVAVPTLPPYFAMAYCLFIGYS